MRDLNISNVVTLRGGFQGTAANEPFGAREKLPHEWVMGRMNEDIPLIIQSFRTTIGAVLKDLDITYAVTKQTGMVDGEKLPHGALPEQPSADLAFWESIESELWGMAVQSYHDDVLQNNRTKYTDICASLGSEALEYMQSHGTTGSPEAGMAIGTAFELAMMKDVEALNKLIDLFTQHIPDVDVKIEMRVLEPEDSGQKTLMTPVLVVTAREEIDLRKPLRRFIDSPQGAGPAGLMPV